MSSSNTPVVLWMAVALLVFTIACNGDSQPDEAGAIASSPGPAIGEHTWTTPDGNRIPYSVAGKTDAEVTVVLVHCWMCNRSFWDSRCLRSPRTIAP